ncbi:MAG TPA: type IV secretory system conjugative DNA transfer family protein, partial [Candidatus Competibacteraceae bacterium]|nr:type IV secretory system conjugative DNA transfer family protein [Candidatus Competibacteraceae bacterium]
KEQKHAVELSEALGYQTVTTRSRSRPVGLSARTGGGSVNVSEQRRALFLPQEIKDIGAERELIFLENVKPILAHKIRYYEDRTFKKRLQEAVAIKPLPFVERPAAPSLQDGGAPKPPTTEMKIELQPITPKDMDVIDTLRLEDFSCDFDHIKIPQQPISDTEMQRTVDSFLLSMSD